jgi:predicted nucleic acid-binding Zn ribbon protein
MMESDSNSIKYWKRSAVLSATIAFLFLMYSVVVFLSGDVMARFPLSGIDSRLYLGIFAVQSVIALVLFALYLAFGILAVRGNKIGVVGGLILSIIITIGNFVYSGILGLALGIAGIFLALIFPLPIILLPLFNIYYSFKAIRRDINDTLMSIYTFLACSLQQGLGMFVIVPWIWIAPLSFPLLIVSAILFIRAGEHLLNKEEGTVSKKRIYITNVLSLLLIFVSLWIPIWIPALPKDVRSFASASALIYFSFALPIIVSSVIASSCFVAFIPKRLGVGVDVSYQSTFLSRDETSHPQAGGFRQMEEGGSGDLLLRYEGIPRYRPIIGQSRLEEGSILYCRYCGRAIPEDSVFCPYCGRRLRWEVLGK